MTTPVDNIDSPSNHDNPRRTVTSEDAPPDAEEAPSEDAPPDAEEASSEDDEPPDVKKVHHVLENYFNEEVQHTQHTEDIFEDDLTRNPLRQGSRSPFHNCFGFPEACLQYSASSQRSFLHYSQTRGNPDSLGFHESGSSGGAVSTTVLATVRGRSRFFPSFSPPGLLGAESSSFIPLNESAPDSFSGQTARAVFGVAQIGPGGP